jgi:hypothetical protein
MTEENTQNTTEETEDTRKRIRYNIQDDAAKVFAVFDNEQVEMSPLRECEDKAVHRHLLLLGLVSYLQKATVRVEQSEKITAVEMAYNDLLEKGMEVFKPKPSGFTSRGPRKADKIAALAAIKGVMPSVVEAKLKDMDNDRVEAILNHPDVLAKVEALAAQPEDLDL